MSCVCCGHPKMCVHADDPDFNQKNVRDILTAYPWKFEIIEENIRLKEIITDLTKKIQEMTDYIYELHH